MELKIRAHDSEKIVTDNANGYKYRRTRGLMGKGRCKVQLATMTSTLYNSCIDTSTLDKLCKFAMFDLSVVGQLAGDSPLGGMVSGLLLNPRVTTEEASSSKKICMRTLFGPDLLRIMIRSRLARILLLTLRPLRSSFTNVVQVKVCASVSESSKVLIILIGDESSGCKNWTRSNYIGSSYA